MVGHTNQTPTITYRRSGTVGLQGGLSSSARLTRLRTTALDHSYLLITLHEYDTVKFYGGPQRMAPPATRNTLHRTATRIIYSGDTRNCDCCATAAGQGAPVYTGTDCVVSRCCRCPPERQSCWKGVAVATDLRGANHSTIDESDTALVWMVAAASLPACPITIMRRGSGRRCSQINPQNAPRSASRRPESNSASCCDHCV